MNKRNIKRAIKNGHTPLDVAKMQAIANHSAEKMMKKAKKEAFVEMLMIPCAVLAFDFWQNSAKKRMPEFIKQVVCLYESIEVGAVTREEILETFKELSGMELVEEWSKNERTERIDTDERNGSS
jgi:hypothetical protein